MTGPLQGVRVLDLTTMLSGPCAAQTLAEMGADVTKVETPEGDNLRNIGRSRTDGMGPMHLHANRGKRSIALDLKSEQGRNAFLALIKLSDVLICNVRTNAMRRLGLGYEDVKKVNPSLIYVSIVGYGSGGPYSDRPAYDDLIQAAVGIPSLGTSLEGGARYAPIAVADRVTGMNAANAALGALYHRLRTGEGQYVEVAMFETMAFMVLSDHMGGRTYEPPLGPTVFERYASVRRPFPTSDGVVCLVLVNDKQWTTFFSLVGLEKSSQRRTLLDRRKPDQKYECHLRDRCKDGRHSADRLVVTRTGKGRYSGSSAGHNRQPDRRSAPEGRRILRRGRTSHRRTDQGHEINRTLVGFTA